MFGMSSQMDGGFTASQYTQSASSKSNGQPMVPVTVKQIMEAIQSTDEKSNFIINGTDVSNVKLLGLVAKKVERNTDVSFELDDGTGRIDCTRWINDTSDKNEVEELSEEMYVRVHGHLKVFQGQKKLGVFAIRPVKDYNEIATHFLECIYSNSNKDKVQDGVTLTSSTPLPNGSNGNQSTPSNQFVGQYDMDGLKGLDKMVIEYLEQNSGVEKGVHRDEIAQQLKVPIAKIMQIIDTLETEGLIYSSIDEFHFKSTSSG